MLFWIWLRPRYKIPEFFTIVPVLIYTLIRRLYIGLRVLYKYYKKTAILLVWPGAAHALIEDLSQPTSVSLFRTTIDVCKILSRLVEIWQYEGQKPVFG